MIKSTVLHFPSVSSASGCTPSQTQLINIASFTTFFVVISCVFHPHSFTSARSYSYFACEASLSMWFHGCILFFANGYTVFVFWFSYTTSILKLYCVHADYLLKSCSWEVWLKYNNKQIDKRRQQATRSKYSKQMKNNLKAKKKIITNNKYKGHSAVQQIRYKGKKSSRKYKHTMYSCLYG